MLEAKYEIVEQDGERRDEILSYMMFKHLMQGVAYFCLVEGRKPMSPSEMTEFCRLKDPAYTEKFNQAVAELVEKGFLREVT